MPVTDSIADFLTRIRNAGAAKHRTVKVPYSKMKFSIAEILKEQGFVADVDKQLDNIQGEITVTLKYYKRMPVIREITRISKPGRRVYSPVDKLPRVRNGLGMAIISTPKGILTDKEARKLNVGGEVLCTIW